MGKGGAVISGEQGDGIERANPGDGQQMPVVLIPVQLMNESFHLLVDTLDQGLELLEQCASGKIQLPRLCCSCLRVLTTVARRLSSVHSCCAHPA